MNRKWVNKKVAGMLCIGLILGLFLHIQITKAEQGNTVGIANPRWNGEIVTWDCLYFGDYWQSNVDMDGKADRNDEKEPIKWRVLSVDGNDVFLMSDKVLDCQRYNETNESVTWETCTMRSWLNGYGADSNTCKKDYTSDNFLDNAFSVQEQEAIKDVEVVTADNSNYNTTGGNNTSDKIYLLSLDEIMNQLYGFNSTNELTLTRRAGNTTYAIAQGALNMAASTSDYFYSGYWWLRSPGNGNRRAVYIDNVGYINAFGIDVDNGDNGVRPVMHLDLSVNSTWYYAGEVTSEGAIHEIALPSATPSVSSKETESPIPTAKETSTETVSQNQWVKTDSVSATGGTVPTITPAPSLSEVQPEIVNHNKIDKVVLNKIKRVKKKNVLIKWNKIINVSGYQLQFSTTKRFKKVTNKTTVNSSIKVKKLKKKKTYYFRVRAYKKMAGRKVYGKWSNIKKIRM